MAQRKYEVVNHKKGKISGPSMGHHLVGDQAPRIRRSKIFSRKTIFICQQRRNSKLMPYQNSRTMMKTRGWRVKIQRWMEKVELNWRQKSEGFMSKAFASGLLVTAPLKHGASSIRARRSIRKHQNLRNQNLRRIRKRNNLLRGRGRRRGFWTSSRQSAEMTWNLRTTHVITTISRSSVKCDDGRQKSQKYFPIFFWGKFYVEIGWNFERGVSDQFSF